MQQNVQLLIDRLGKINKLLEDAGWRLSSTVGYLVMEIPRDRLLQWSVQITAHIPNKGEQLARYYGAYSNVSGGKRKKEKVEEEPTEVTEVPPPLVSKELKNAVLTLSGRSMKRAPLPSPMPGRHTWNPALALPLRRTTPGRRFCFQ